MVSIEARRGNMSELEALNWLKARDEFHLNKSGRLYTLSIPGASVQRESIIECIIEMKKRLNA